MDGGREGSNCCMVRLLMDIGLSLSYYSSSYLKGCTQYISFNWWITFFNLDCHLELELESIIAISILCTYVVALTGLAIPLALSDCGLKILTPAHENWQQSPADVPFHKRLANPVLTKAESGDLAWFPHPN